MARERSTPSTPSTPSTQADWSDLFGRWWRRDFPELWRGALEEAEFRVEEFDEEDARVIRAELPGVDPDENIDITVEGDVLSIRAERREEKEAEEKGRLRSEFRYGSFTRSMRLPSGSSVEDVEATYRDGVLEVRVPLDRTKAPAERIPIQRG